MKKNISKIFVIAFTLLIAIAFPIFTQGLPEHVLPDSYYTFRDDMYNFAKTPDEMHDDYETYIAQTENDFSEGKISKYEYYLYMSRYEFIMARVYHYDNNFPEAEKYFDRGMDFGNKAMKENENAQSVLIYVENLSMNCIVKPVSWVIANGPKVATLDKKVFSYDKRNGAALYMSNAQDIFAPSPFNNVKRGIVNMKSFLTNPNYDLDTDDRFNITAAVGYGYMLQKNKADAELWFKKALEIYPGNKYIQGLMEAL